MNAYATATHREKQDTPPPKPTEEMKARVREKLAAFKLQHAAFRRERDGETKPVEEMTDEKKAELRRMLALPDRGGVTEEERQYRATRQKLTEA